MAVLAITAATLVTQLRSKTEVTKMCFNVAKSAASASAAVLVILALPPIRGAGPGTWGILFAAVSVSAVVHLAALAGVMSVRAGPPRRSGGAAGRPADAAHLRDQHRDRPGLPGRPGRHQVVAVLLTVLIVALILVLRSFAEFFRQHRTLADVYELTRAVREQGHRRWPAGRAAGPGAVADALRVRDALALPQGRHPEVLLTARVENKGLLDLSPTPAVIRERAITAGRTTPVGSRFGENEDLRPTLRSAKIKDVIVVPLRSARRPSAPSR